MPVNCEKLLIDRFNIFVYALPQLFVAYKLSCDRRYSISAHGKRQAERPMPHHKLQWRNSKNSETFPIKSSISIALIKVSRTHTQHTHMDIITWKQAASHYFSARKIVMKLNRVKCMRWNQHWMIRFCIVPFNLHSGLAHRTTPHTR